MKRCRHGFLASICAVQSCPHYDGQDSAKNVSGLKRGPKRTRKPKRADAGRRAAS